MSDSLHVSSAAAARVSTNDLLSSLENVLHAASVESAATGTVGASTCHAGVPQAQPMMQGSLSESLLSPQTAGQLPIGILPGEESSEAKLVHSLSTAAEGAATPATKSPTIRKAGWLSGGRSMSDAAATIERVARSPASQRSTPWNIMAPAQDAGLPTVVLLKQFQAEARLGLGLGGLAPVPPLQGAPELSAASAAPSSSRAVSQETAATAAAAAMRGAAPAAGRRVSASSILLSTSRFGGAGSGKPKVLRSLAELVAAPSSYPVLAAAQQAREAQAVEAAQAAVQAAAAPPLLFSAADGLAACRAQPPSPRQSARRHATASGVRFTDFDAAAVDVGDDEDAGEASATANAAAAACASILRAAHGPTATGDLLAKDAALLAAGSGVFADEEAIVSASAVALLAQQALHAQLVAGDALDRSLRLHVAESLATSPLDRSSMPGVPSIVPIRSTDHPYGHPGSASATAVARAAALASRAGASVDHSRTIAALQLDWARASAYEQLLRRTGSAASGARSRAAASLPSDLKAGLRQCLRFLREVRSLLLRTCAALTLDVAHAIAARASELSASPPSVAPAAGAGGADRAAEGLGGLRSPSVSIASPARSVGSRATGTGGSSARGSGSPTPASRAPSSSDLRAAARSSADVLAFFQALRGSVNAQVGAVGGPASAAAAAVQLLVRVRAACKRLQAELHSMEASAAAASAGLEAELSSVFASGRQVRFSSSAGGLGAAAAAATGVAALDPGRARRGSLISILGGARTMSSGRSGSDETRSHPDDDDAEGDGRDSDSARSAAGKAKKAQQQLLSDAHTLADDAVLLRGLLSREWDGRTFGAESDVPTATASAAAGAAAGKRTLILSPIAPSPAVLSPAAAATAALRGTCGSSRAGWLGAATAAAAVQMLGASGLTAPMNPAKAPGSKVALAAWRRMPAPPVSSGILPSFDSAAPQPRPGTGLAADAVRTLRDPSTFAALVAAPVPCVTAAAAEQPVKGTAGDDAQTHHDHSSDASSTSSDDYHDHEHHDDSSSVGSDASYSRRHSSSSRRGAGAAPAAAASYGEARGVMMTNTWLLWRHALLHVQWHMRQRVQRLLTAGAGLEDHWTALIAPEAFLPESAASLLRPRTLAHAAGFAGGGQFVPLHRDSEARRTADLHAALCVYRLLEAAALASSMA